MHVVDPFSGCEIVVMISLDNFRTGPNVSDEIGMRIVHAAVDHRNYNLVAALRDTPGPHRPDVRTRFAAVRAVVRQPPLAREHFVVDMHMLAAGIFMIKGDLAVGLGGFDFIESTVLRYAIIRDVTT